MSALPSITVAAQTGIAELVKSDYDNVSNMPSLTLTPGLDVKMPIHTRAKSDQLDQLRRDPPLSHEKVRLQSSSFISEDASKDSATTDPKKSKPVTRKLKELNGVTTISNQNIPAANVLTASPGMTSGRGRSGSNAKNPVHIPSLTLDRVPGAATAAADPVVFQHFSLPKSLTSSTPSTKLTAPSAQKSVVTPRADVLPVAPTPTQVVEFVFVDGPDMAASGKDEQQQVVENDRILQERLQEAKALNRKDDQGATMHTFALWKRPKNLTVPSALPSAPTTPGVAAAGAAAPVETEQPHRPKSASRLRGPKAALAAARWGDRASSVDEISDGYSDDDFVDVNDELDDDVNASDVSQLSNQSGAARSCVARNLAAALRSRVVDAQQLQSPTASPMRAPGSVVALKSQGVRHDPAVLAHTLEALEVNDELESSYNSFAQATMQSVDLHNNSVSVIGDAHGSALDDEVSDVSEEGDLDKNWEPDHDVNDAASIHTIMSKSGPAAFGAVGSLVVQAPSVPLALDTMDAPVRRASASEVEFPTAAAAGQFKSLTSRDPHSSAEQSTPPSGKKLSKYQVLRNLRSANKKLQQLDTLDGKASGSLPASLGDSVTKSPAVSKRNGTAPRSKATAMVVKKAPDGPAAEQGRVGREIPSSSGAHSPPQIISGGSANGVEINVGEDFEATGEEHRSPLRWKKGETIGEGTFGRVFKGLNEKTGELLAIKQLCLADGSEREVEELQKEIDVMWELDHENIVRYLGTNKTERYLFIILEFVTGGSVASMLAQFGPFSESLLRRFSCQILSGVAYLHSKGIIHRDIKGANILVTDAGVAKLADFGCSKRLPGLCSTSLEESMLAIRGSIPWMAPEVIKQSGYGRSSDIWSFGATVIEMASGKPPWMEYANNLAALFHVATTNEPPKIPEHLSPECCDFLKCCLVIEPEKRSSAQALLNQAAFLKPEVEKAASTHGTPIASARKRAPPPPHLIRSSTGGATSGSVASSSAASQSSGPARGAAGRTQSEPVKT